MNLKIKHIFPSTNEFNDLFDSVGWGKREKNKIEQHKLTSVFSVCVYNEDIIVGMARVVGDGAYYTIYDVVTRKSYQNKGIGKILMEEILNWYKSIEDSDTHLYLGASLSKEKFYEKFNFVARPYGHLGAGMKYDPAYKK